MIDMITIAQAPADNAIPAAPTAPAPAAPAAPAPAAPAAPAATAGTVQPTEQAPQAEAQPEQSVFSMLLPFVLIAVIFYFLLIRPQQQKQKEMQQRQDSLKVGDKVVTIGGIYGIVREVLDAAVRLEVAPNVLIKFDKRSIAANISKDGTPETDKK